MVGSAGLERRSHMPHGSTVISFSDFLLSNDSNRGISNERSNHQKNFMRRHLSALLSEAMA